MTKDPSDDQLVEAVLARPSRRRRDPVEAAVIGVRVSTVDEDVPIDIAIAGELGGPDAPDPFTGEAGGSGPDVVVDLESDSELPPEPSADDVLDSSIEIVAQGIAASGASDSSCPSRPARTPAGTSRSSRP